MTELHGLQKLEEATPPRAPDHAMLLYRMATDFVELEYLARSDENASLRADAHANAVALLERVVTQYPDFARLDQALLVLALEHQKEGDFADARKTYSMLIEMTPTSPLVADAHLATGEMLFDEAASDPSKLALAASAYERAIQSAQPRNAVYGYAWYKLAWVRRNEGDPQGAIDAFEKTIAFCDAFPGLPGAAQLRKAAREDLGTLDADANEDGASVRK